LNLKPKFLKTVTRRHKKLVPFN